MINQRFEIIRKIGEGRSSVYLCGDIEFPDSLVAIKILPADTDEIEKQNFRNEFFTLQNLEHPNILHANETGTVIQLDNEKDISISSPYIVLEYFESDELLHSTFLKNEEQLKEIVKQICSVLSYLHLSNYIYYDLKPENILVSSKGKDPLIKLIDMGLAVNAPSATSYEVTGTAQYIAPELLKKEPHNENVDLYSLGMLLYRIIYGDFPFHSLKEIEIYKAQIENEFEFPSSQIYSEDIIEIVKKLLNKKPAKRYQSALQVIEDLSFDVNAAVAKDFAPAQIFTNRKDTLNILSTYINDKTSSEVFVVKGFDGSGKTSLLVELLETYPNSILINNIKGKSGIELVKYVLRKLFFSEFVYPFIKPDEIKIFSSLLSSTETELLKQLPSAISKVASRGNFIFLIDDYNLFDEFSSEVFNDLLPILQINNTKVILSESSELQHNSSRLNNVREITIGSFTDVQLKELVDKSFSSEFPKEELYKLILSYSDLLPGSIISFIKDLCLLGIMEFTPSGVQISSEEEKISQLSGSQTQIYSLRLNNLTGVEQEAANILGALETTIEQGALAEIMDLSEEEIQSLISNLQINNIIQKNPAGTAVVLTSDGLKKFIYSELAEKEKFHRSLANKLSGNLPSFNKIELARQFELGKNYDMCFNTFMSELNEVEKLSLFSYMKKILTSMLKIPFTHLQTNQVQFKLSEVNFKLSDFKASLNNIESVVAEELEEEKQIGLAVIKGSSLIGLGEYEKGKEYINSIISNLTDGKNKHILLTELAYAEFDQNKFTEAFVQCKNILNQKKLSDELKGKCYNLLGMYEILQNNDTRTALQWFTKALESYDKAKLPRRIAGIEVNIANIYNLLGEFSKAEEHWANASEINNSVGNLEQEGLLLLNVGVHHHHKRNTEKSIQLVNRAYKIFLSLGKEISESLALLNLGEMHMYISEYQKSYDSLSQAEMILKRHYHPEELAELYLTRGKFFFKVGDAETLTKIKDEFSNHLLANTLPKKQLNNLNYLEQLEAIINNNDVNIDQFKTVVKNYFEGNEKFNFSESLFILTEYLISSDQYDEALNLITMKEIIEICKQSIIFEAEREYFLGKISLVLGSDKLLPPIDHFENAYKLIQEESITELTWKILWALAESYRQRGNEQKTKNYTNYAKELIQFVADQISNMGLRNIYLQKEERKTVLQN